ncbi:MAG: hypothetical protein H0U18_11295 [Pyrinomonadaceae bacterium]|nr:hypothetical protein [Pyrinomonadaceae bacterium]
MPLISRLHLFTQVKQDLFHVQQRLLTATMGKDFAEETYTTAAKELSEAFLGPVAQRTKRTRVPAAADLVLRLKAWHDKYEKVQPRLPV